MPKLDELARVEIATAEELERWLKSHHAQPQAVWLVTWKKGAGRPHVPREAVLEALLSYGWIDSLPRKLDADRSMLLIAPRKPKSAWSAVNRSIVERLTAEGRMQPSGLAAVAAAKANGNWSALDAVEALELPADLQSALAQSETALRNFAAFPRSAKRGILEWIMSARKPETRGARIAEAVAKAKDNIRANQWRQSRSP